MHDKNFWRQCDHCAFKTKSRNTIANHIQRHFKDSNKFMCSQCPKSFAISALLRKHSFLLHKQCESGCYYCKNCNYCFLFKTEYKQHIDKKCNGPTGKKWPIHSTRIRRNDLHRDCQIIELPKN